MSLGYLALAGIFAAGILACFAFAIWELIRPRDPGPLPIDVRRDIQDRHFAHTLRSDTAGALDDGAEVSGEPDPVFVRGTARVAPGTRSGSFVCDGVATIGEGAVVAGHAEGVDGLVLESGARVEGRATSAGDLILAPGASVRFAAAPYIHTMGVASAEEPDKIAAWDPALDMSFDWLLRWGTAIDEIARALAAVHGSSVDLVEALLRAERRGSLGAALAGLAEAARPSWWRDGAGAWYLGAATVRVRGSLDLPPHSIVPFHLIVDGDFAAGEGCHLHGSVHAGRDLALGERCRVEGSAVARRDARIDGGSSVGECVWTGRDLVVGPRVWIGSQRNGGLAAGRGARLGAGVVVRNKLYAESGAHAAGPLRAAGAA